MSEKCDICAKEVEELGSQIWTSPDGEKLAIPHYSKTLVAFHIDGVEKQVCEECYADLGKGAQKSNAEMHYQFALEFYNDGKVRRAFFAMAKAYRLDPKSSKLLGYMALCLDSLGHRKWARLAYGKALELNPDDRLTAHNFRLFEDKMPGV